ncbi:MAG: PilZ domain-containing protein [Myxococcota bacterium]
MNQSMQNDAGQAAGDDPFIVLQGAVKVSGVRLAKILQEAGIETCELTDECDIGQVLQSLSTPPDLLILSLADLQEESLASLHASQTATRGRTIPILGIATPNELGSDLRALRAHGVVGVLDSRTTPNNALDRVVRHIGPDRRGSERVPCIFPVIVSLDEGRGRREFALDLSNTGLRLTSATQLELNSDIQLRFRLPLVRSRPIETSARVVRVGEKRNTWGRFEIGVFLTDLEPSEHAAIESEVERLLGN